MCNLLLENLILQNFRYFGVAKRLKTHLHCHAYLNFTTKFSTVMSSKKSFICTSPIPFDVSERLKTLHNDVINAVLEQTEYECQSSIKQYKFKLNENLEEMAKYYFIRGGKLFRPTVNLLMSSACNQNVAESSNTKESSINSNQYKIAIISEMIHTASLVHDDVIDKSEIRRGKPTVNARWGNRQAVLVGDFILSRATKLLCSIGQPKVIQTMAEIVEDLVKGELMQLSCSTGLNAVERFQQYMLRTFYKSASLFANSCKSVAMLSGGNEHLQKKSFDFGRHLGIAFQLVDDILDYISSSSVLGKPAANDLKLGLATCPVLFAAKKHPELNQLIDRKFSLNGDVEKAYTIVLNSDGLENTRNLAKQHCEAAINIINELPNNNFVRDCLIEIISSQLDRNH